MAIATTAIAVALFAQSAGAGGTGPLEAVAPSVSGDGRYIAFETGLDLGGPVTPGVLSIYVYDRVRDKLELVSRRSKSAGGSGADENSRSPAISADGRYVAFWTVAENLGGPIAGESNVYVYDRNRDRVELVSRRSKAAGGGGGNGGVQLADVAISGNGRVVAFSTDSTNLGGPIAPGPFSNVYAYDREHDRITLVSRRSKAAGGGGAEEGGHGPALSASGRYAAFFSVSDNLPGDTGVYVYDLLRKRLELVSRRSKSAGGAPADEGGLAPSLSASARFVAFTTSSDNLGGPIDPAATNNVYVYDRKLKRVQLVSRQSKAAGGAGGDVSNWGHVAGDGAVLSASGRLIAFTTQADNLGGPLDDTVDNVYVYDRKLKRVRLVSRQSAGAGGQGADGDSESPAISGDGRFVAFDTQGDNLGGPAVIPGTRRVFFYDRSRSRVTPVVAGP